jgi:hypothetical protein
MACPPKLYINSDHVISFGTLTNFTLSDVSDLSVTLSDGTNTVTKTMSGGGVEIVDSVMFFVLTETDVTTSGVYKVSVMLTDTEGNTIRLTPCPETLRFYD